MYGKHLNEFFMGTFRNQFEFSTSLTYRIRQNDKMTLKKPQKLLCEIKKRKATIWRKIWDKVVAAPEKKYDQIAAQSHKLLP